MRDLTLIIAIIGGVMIGFSAGALYQGDVHTIPGVMECDEYDLEPGLFICREIVIND